MAIEENRKIITSKFTDSISNEQKRLKWLNGLIKNIVMHIDIYHQKVCEHCDNIM